MRNVTLAFVLLIAGYTAPAVAQEKDWYVVFDCGSSRGCQQFWGAGEKRLGPATKAECDEAIRNRSANSYPIGARCVQNPAGGGATTPPSSTASALESTIANGLSALPLDQQLVIGAGYSLLRLIFDDADRSDARARAREGRGGTCGRGCCRSESSGRRAGSPGGRRARPESAARPGHP
jgi:hypothetical protein